MTDTVAFNPDDPAQQSFLNALAFGETGTAGTSAQYLGNSGGGDLSGASTDAYGFPVWGGVGNSHAAGIFQFQPATWDTEAKQYGLSFGNTSDQEAAAWYYAQSTYATNTGGGSLESAVQAGNVSSISSALGKVFTSVSSAGFQSALTAGSPVNLFGGSASGGTGTGTGSSSSGSSSGSSSTSIISYLQRFGLMLVGAIIVFIAIWKLISDTGTVPGPDDVAKMAKAAV